MAVAESEPAVKNGEDPILGGAECERKEKGKRGKHICPFPSRSNWYKLQIQLKTLDIYKNIRQL